MLEQEEVVDFDIDEPSILELDMASSEEGLDQNSREISQKTFQQLLKTSMDLAGNNEEFSDSIMRGTVETVSSGNFLKMDVNSILGDALSTLTEELGIDMNKEIANDEQASGQMKV